MIARTVVDSDQSSHEPDDIPESADASAPVRCQAGSRNIPATTRANGEPAGATRLSESGADMGAYGAGALEWIVLALRVKVPAVDVTSLPKSFTNTSGEVLAVPVDL